MIFRANGSQSGPLILEDPNRQREGATRKDFRMREELAWSEQRQTRERQAVGAQVYAAPRMATI